MSPVNPRIAFIGTRELAAIPAEAVALFVQAARKAARHGYDVITGAARGADQLAAETALDQGGRVLLALPWSDYNLEWQEEIATRYASNQVKTVVYDPAKMPSWAASVDRYHPKPEALSDAGRRLMARNYGIVFGATAVVALPRPPEEGGTGQGIRIARGLGIPIYNLSLEEGRQAFLQKLERRAECV